MENFDLILPETIKTTEALPYMEFLNLFKDAKMVLTDSGGIQEETTALGVPCLTMRENTERPITITEGTNILVGIPSKNLFNCASEILKGNVKSYIKPNLWDGDASNRLINIILHDIPLLNNA